MDKKPIITRKYMSPCGEMLLGAYGGALCLCDWSASRVFDRNVRRLLRSSGALSLAEGDADVLDRAVGQLDEYFAGTRREFELPVLSVGTDFQQMIWSALRDIPYGTTVSYSELAGRVGRPRGVRAVAVAVGANPLSIIVPCHRVVGADGSLTGYAGGLDAKRRLLGLEAR